jgi:hypothetical protein
MFIYRLHVFKKRVIGNYQTIFDNAWMKSYKRPSHCEARRSFVNHAADNNVLKLQLHFPFFLDQE